MKHEDSSQTSDSLRLRVGLRDFTPFSGGTAELQFPFPNHDPGRLDIIFPVSSYLQYNWGNCNGQVTDTLNDSPCARATFGIYKSPLIYRRENY